MKQFYSIFCDKKVSPLATQLSWSHYIELLSIKDESKLKYYLEICINQNLSRNDLRLRIKNKEYERLDNETKNKLILKENSNVVDFVKNPILIKNSYDYSEISERILQKLILEDISNFLNELGSGFSFIKNEYKIKIGDKYNYIDLLLYNIEFNCYVVVELKVTELKKEHIGQIQVYMNYIDINLKKINQNKTIGIIICKKGDKYIIQYSSDKRIISSEYEVV